ncbi:hypothetical protein HGRIS_005397 [Hohenbuehelia grisea]|uniref:Xylanolytic transcriptional activator regulatory domain-containing protein n=1 Tax=Hohenbuehelia grisea TaxID=104357 RepID=A0ABR3JEX2_9AGAR
MQAFRIKAHPAMSPADRDSARWNLDPTTVQRRRSLFWDIFAADVSHSLALGRPPAIHLSYVDCEFPFDEEATLNDAQEVQHGFWRMKHTFARDIFYAVLETTLTAKSPSYSTVLDLDRKVRELSFPAAFKPYARREDGEEEYFSSSLSLRAYYASQHRTVTMLYLHRSFFAQAMIDYPANPLLSPFAPSFLTAYRCASINIKATAHQFDRCPEIGYRLWFLLYHTFSSAVIVGSVVTHSPNSPMASSALLDLGLAVELFEKAAAKSRRARIALAVLRKLKDKAIRSYNQFCSQTLPTQMNNGSTHTSPISGFSSPSSFLGQSSTNEDGDELAIFGGQKRVLTRRHRHNMSSKSSPHTSMTDSPSPPSTHSGIGNSPSPPISHSELSAKAVANGQSQLIPSPTNVHPSLMEYLSHSNMLGIEGLQFPSSSSPNMPPPPSIPASAASSPPAATSLAPPSSPRESGGGMSEMYSSFMSYLATRAISGAPPPSSEVSPAPSSTVSSPQTPDWVMGSALQQANTKVDTTLWAQNASQQVSPAIPTQLPPPGIVHMQAPTMAYPSTLMAIPEVLPTTVPPYSAQGYGYDPNLYGGLFGAGSSNGMAMGSAMSMPVEMGLTTESGMDEGWLSFMRDCGILESGQPSR